MVVEPHLETVHTPHPEPYSDLPIGSSLIALSFRGSTMMEDPPMSDPINASSTPTREEIAAYVEEQIRSIRSQLQPSNRVKPAKSKGYAADRGSDPDLRLFQFEQYAVLVGLTDREKVQLAATFLEGPAAVWWRSVAIELQTHQPPNNIITWTSFKNQLVQQFKPIDSTKMARDRLAELKQVGSVQKYNAEFNRLVLEAGNVGPIEALDRYTRDLKAGIRMEVDLANVSSVQQAQAKAQRVDSIAWQARSNNRPFHNPVPFNNGHARMDISAYPLRGSQTPRDAARQCECYDEAFYTI